MVARTRVQVAYLDRLGSVSILLSVAYVLVLSLGPKLKTALWALFISTCSVACDFSVQPCPPWLNMIPGEDLPLQLITKERELTQSKICRQILTICISIRRMTFLWPAEDVLVSIF